MYCREQLISNWQTLGSHHQCQHDLTAVMSAILAEVLGQKTILLFVGLIVFAFRGKGQRRAIVEQHIHWSLQQLFRRLMGHPAHLVNHRRVEIIHAPAYRIQIKRDARLIGQRLYRRTLALRLRHAGQNQFPHDAVCALAPRPQKRAPAKLVIDRPHHIAEPKRQVRLLAAITKINVQFFRTWGFANNFLKIGIFGGGKQLLPRCLIGSELLHQLPCRTLDTSIAIVMGDTHMAEDFLPGHFAGAHSFDDLDPGPIEFGIMFGAYETCGE